MNIIISPDKQKMEDRWEAYPRVFNRFLTSYSMIIVTIYLLIVAFSGKLMKKFSPLDLKGVLVFHNVVCCILSVVSCVILAIGLLDEHSLVKLDSTSKSLSLGIGIYWISKYYELLDTVFMLLRHKVRQISFLHVFHHATMPFLSDYAYHFAPWPPIAFGMSLNSFVHIVMYSYYAVTALATLHDFSWKRFITQLQILQFCLGIVIGVYGYMYEGYCVFSFLYPFTLAVLFLNYYYNAFYRSKRSKHE